MVMLGYNKETDISAVCAFLKSFDITIGEENKEIGNFNFIEIETKNMLERGICVLGDYYSIFPPALPPELDLFISDEERRTVAEIRERGRKFACADLDFWYDFTTRFTDKFKSAALFRRYDDTDVEISIKKYRLNDFQKNDLLEMKVNGIYEIFLIG